MMGHERGYGRAQTGKVFCRDFASQRALIANTRCLAVDEVYQLFTKSRLDDNTAKIECARVDHRDADWNIDTPSRRRP